MSKYNPEGKTVRSINEIKDGLLSHPDNVGRIEELELLIDWRLALENHLNRDGLAKLEAFNKKMGNEKSQSLRALTLQAEAEGSDVLFRITTKYEAAVQTLLMQPEEKKILFDVERLDNISWCAAAKYLPTKNIIQFEGLAEQFQQNAADTTAAADFVERNFVGKSQQKFDPPMQ